MVDIAEITIISIDKGEDLWAIEGEILFEPDLGIPFSADYYEYDDELENLEIEIIPGGCDRSQLKEMIIRAA